MCHSPAFLFRRYASPRVVAARLCHSDALINDASLTVGGYWVRSFRPVVYIICQVYDCGAESTIVVHQLPTEGRFDDYLLKSFPVYE